MTQISASIREVECSSKHDFVSEIEAATIPIVFRGLGSDWPLVERARESNAEVDRYLRGFYNGELVSAFVSDSDIEGRIFYSDDLSETNYKKVQAEFGWVLDKISEFEKGDAKKTIYMGSTALDYCLPGLREHNSLPMEDFNATVRIWIGNRTTVAAHYDALDNVACVCAGRRRFTLFPPEQLANLYVGPIDFTPAGQAISLVDLNNPDLNKYPRFAEALEQAQTAELEPGDAIFIPSMWWHHVQGLESLNILVNYWWRKGPVYMGAPQDVLLHAILSIRDLPDEQRKAWRGIFDHYVFSVDEDVAGHIPAASRGLLGELDENDARKLRSLLRNKLNR